MSIDNRSDNIMVDRPLEPNNSSEDPEGWAKVAYWGGRKSGYG